MGVGEFGQISAKKGKFGKVWMGQTDLVGMSEMASEWVWVCMKV